MQHTLKVWERARLGDAIVGPARLLQEPLDRFDFAAIEADEQQTYLLNLITPADFYKRCPKHWQRPKQLSPANGIPKHVWLGSDFGPVFPDLLALWPVKRFAFISRAEEDFDLLEYMLSFVRCSNCGRRYDAPQELCDYEHLCGDAPLVPQIEVVTGMETWAKERAQEMGAQWLSWQP